MIIAQIVGGLGNQMFQYALARSLAIRKKVPLYLDISAYRTYKKHREFELKRIFNCAGEIATAAHIRSVLGWCALPGMQGLAKQQSAIRRFLCPQLIFEPHFHYWPKIWEIPDKAYLVGYWQSEKYFSEIADILREDFKFRQPLSETNAQWAEKITHCNSISLHIRRGDYVLNPETYKVHGVCDLDYYYRAIEYMTSLIDDPVFFVFSDEIEWAKLNLRVAYPIYYIENNTAQESYNDMRLMSLCRHHIIANSTFSWWGAWLNPFRGKIVIAPQQWFSIKRYNTVDLIPDSWLRI
ncbi:MAG: alpha-1,2-fucosyltransferase [Thermosynechococcus sp.]|uniref:alpha-1,2-fucosyltransferase n=1 Tax=Thermosynechococcus sp. TaxID=2814275 RepID=UPI00391B5864